MPPLLIAPTRIGSTGIRLPIVSSEQSCPHSNSNPVLYYRSTNLSAGNALDRTVIMHRVSLSWLQLRFAIVASHYIENANPIESCELRDSARIGNCSLIIHILEYVRYCRQMALRRRWGRLKGQFTSSNWPFWL